MWMMGCSNGSSSDHHHHHHQAVNTSDSSSLLNNNNGRTRLLKPLMPRPSTRNAAAAAAAAMSFAITTHPHHPNYILPNCTIHASSSDDLLAFNHRLAERYKKDFEAQQQQLLLGSASSRWNPTPEQLYALEDIYRNGTRTPSSEQIQQIASQLRRFGKIEGKNVFYWFQNHKARERQKRRRIISDSAEPPASSNKEQQQPGAAHHHHHHHHHVVVETLDTPDQSGLRRTSFEVGQTKDCTLPPNCSTISEVSACKFCLSSQCSEPVSIHRAAVVAESRSADSWIQFEERESLQRRNTVKKHDTYQMMELSCSPTTQYFREALTTTIEKNLPTNREEITSNYHHHHQDHQSIIGDQSSSQTVLELFPLRRRPSSSDDHRNGIHYVRDQDHNMTTNFTTPIQFFEFLPLKN